MWKRRDGGIFVFFFQERPSKVFLKMGIMAEKNFIVRNCKI